MTSKKLLIINGWFLVIMGVLLVLMTLVGRFAGNGMFAILQERSIGAIGMFEGFTLAGLFGVVFLRVAKSIEELKFWNLPAGGIHLTLGTANVIFWSDTFVAVGAEVPGTAVTSVHF